MHREQKFLVKEYKKVKSDTGGEDVVLVERKHSHVFVLDAIDDPIAVHALKFYEEKLREDGQDFKADSVRGFLFDLKSKEEECI